MSAVEDKRNVMKSGFGVREIDSDQKKGAPSERSRKPR